MTDDEYYAHISDPGNAPHLTITAKCYHSTGSVGFSDKGFNPFDINYPFHSFMLRDGLPAFDYSLYDNFSVGDFSIKTPAGMDTTIYKSFDFIGQQCEIRLGDNRWTDHSDDFRVIATAIISAVNYQGNGKYDFELTDYGYKLEEPVQPDNKLLVYGVAKNVKPQIVDETTLTVRFHADDATGYTLTVLDKGLDVTANTTINYTAGTLVFNVAPTALDNVRVNISAVKQTALDIIQTIATKNGLGTVSTAGFGTLQTNAVHSVVIRDGESMSSVFERIMSSIGGHYTLDNLGNIKLVYADLTGTPAYTLGKDNSTRIETSGSIHALSKLIVKYNRNHDPYTDAGLATSLTETQKKPLIDEWSIIEKTTTASQGVLDEFQEYETTLSNQTDAQSFADERAIYRAENRIVYTTNAGPYSSRFEMGDLIQINQDDFAGVAMITGMQQKAGKTTNEIEVTA